MRLRNDLILRQMGEEYVIVDPSQDVVDMSKVFTLNETAAYIWQELEDVDFDIEFLAKVVTDKYEVSYEQAIEDSQVLIEQFKNEGLLSD